MGPISRRSFVGQATAGLAALSTLGSTANAQFVYTTSSWKMAEFDKLLKHPARVKQVYDATGINGGKFLNNIKNSLNGLHFGYGIPASQIKIISAMHGPANMLSYDDHIWQKYRIGEWLKITDPKTGQPTVRNLYYPSAAGDPPKYASQDPNDENSVYQDISMQALQSRGVQFLCCHTATEEQVRALVRQYKFPQKPEEIVQEMQAHTVPGIQINPSMVSAIALLQSEGHYTYITVV
jgi:hypothetical protein